MFSQPGKPPAQEDQPYQPGQPNALVMELFDGINTNTTRPGVDDKQCFWIDGWMPLGPRKLRTLPGLGAAAYTVPAGKTVAFFDFANIAAAGVMMIFLSDGSIVQYNTTIGGTTNVAPAGTIQNPSRTTVGISQWGNQYVLIVADQPNGYWVWDGTYLYTAGTLAPGVNLVSNGSGYVTVPTVTAYGGTGNSATFLAQISGGLVSDVSITGIGQGYGVNDVVGLAFAGGGGGTTAIVIPTVNAGTLSTASIINNGTGYSASAAAQVVGGGGIGGSITLSISAGTLTSVSIVARGQGYTSVPTILITDPNNTVAQGTANLMPFGLMGNAIETYSGRVWVANGADVVFSAPGSVTNFSTSSGGGNFTSVDSFLRVGFTELVQTNGFLYLIADSSINYISGVQTSGNPPTTTFTNQNADPETGTVWPGTVDLWGRNIVFANAFGAHVSYGAAVTKISENLDGVYTSVPNFGGIVPSAAKAIVFAKKVWVLLIPIIDPITGLQVNKLFMWDGKRWWSSNQEVAIEFIQHQEINSVLTAWATDGNSIYPMFQQASAGFTKTVQSKMWTNPGYQWNKTTNLLWALFQFQKASPINVTVTIDSENTPYTLTYTSPTRIIPVKNASGVTIPTVNGSLQTINVVSVAAGLVPMAPQVMAQQGVMLGMTAATVEADITLISMAIQPEIHEYRG